MDTILEKKKGLKKKHIPYLVGGGALLIAIIWLVLGDHSTKLRTESKGITISDVTRGEFNDYIRINGQVLPIGTVQLSALEGGMVAEKLVEEGTMVKAGDVIVRLSNPSLSLQILESETRLAEQENYLRNTQVAMQQEKLTLQQSRLSLDLDVERKKRRAEQYEKLYAENLVSREENLMAHEDYEHAKARGAKVYAELSGVGLITDTHHITAPHPRGEAARLAMKAAIEDAMLNITDIGHINTHGTSTPLGDLSECLAIRDLFGAHAYNLTINATKSMTGHMLGAAGAAEAIATILALNTGKVPPTINLKEKDPAIPDYNFVPSHAIEQRFNVAISNSFGFGGHNASLVFSKFD